MFYKCKMNDVGRGCLYQYVIVEAEHSDDAYDRALGHMPQLFGEADEDEFPVEVAAPLAESWPVFTDAYFTRVFSEREARYSKRS